MYMYDRQYNSDVMYYYHMFPTVSQGLAPRH